MRGSRCPGLTEDQLLGLAAGALLRPGATAPVVVVTAGQRAYAWRATLADLRSETARGPATVVRTEDGGSRRAPAPGTSLAPPQHRKNPTSEGGTCA